MPFRDIYGLKFPIQLLNTAFKGNHLANAYLLSGLEGIGKSYLIRRFAQMINCEQGANCQSCANCRLFELGNHPDFIIIKPTGNSIKIKQIHELIEQISLKPSYAKTRVILIKDTHKFTRESANAFLKTLEEPPRDTILVLTTPDENLLLETIISRCQRISAAPLEKYELEAVIKQKYNFSSPQQIEFCLNFCAGAIRKDFINRVEELYDLRFYTFEMLEQLTPRKMIDHCVKIAEIVKKELHYYFIEFLLSWFYDQSCLRYQAGTVIYNQDLADQLKNSNTAFSLEQLEWGFNLIQETEKSIRGYAQKNLALESLLIQLKQLHAGKILI